MMEAFRKGLLDMGYSEGRDVVIEWRIANGNYDRLPYLASDLAQQKVDVIVAGSTQATQAAKRATSTIPIVMVHISDPVGSGLVASLSHPGGNVTGFSLMTSEISVKRLQLLKEAIPTLARVAVMWNPDTSFHPKVIEEFKAVAPSLSMELSFVTARTPAQFEPAFLAISRAHAQALYVIDDAFFFTHRRTLLTLALRARLPVVYGAKEFAEEGALIFYGADIVDSVRQSVVYIDKILRGSNPRDLPIEQPTKFELVVNLRTAKTLGITIPESILLRADEVIR
jgi:putative ABC transport system substrate-binding protein